MWAKCLSFFDIADVLVHHILNFFRFASAPIFVSDTPLSPMGPSSPSQEGLFTDLRLLSLEKQLNIELKVNAAFNDTSEHFIF